jgi:hypothetical protein
MIFDAMTVLQMYCHTIQGRATVGKTNRRSNLSRRLLQLVAKGPKIVFYDS